METVFRSCCCLAAVILTASSVHAEDQPSGLYAQSVKPLLTAKCVRCHGPDKQQSGLRLDTARGAIAGGDSGPAVIPKKSADSLLLHAVTATNGASKMPPEGPPLSEAEIRLLRDWIDAGALAPVDEVIAESQPTRSDHWSFQPVRPIPPPTVKNGTWPQTGIDAFILSRLEAEGVTPSRDAERTTLLRRVHLDLLGLPPSPELVDEFLADTAPDAYDRLIDRLLASPHFGERWGRDWLDAARYADSNGYTRDMPRTIWKYRDWVIDAINANQPFDEFTVEQIAGDLLPEPTLAQRVATGFHRNTLINEEGGTDPEQFRVEAVVDRVNTTGAVYLGLTVGCAQCHNHKYDPISQRDYYQLFAFYNTTAFNAGNPALPIIDVPTAEQIRGGEPQRKQQIRDEIAKLESELKAQTDAIQAAQDAWELTLTMDDKKALPFNVKNAVDLPLRDRSDIHKRDLAAFFRGTKTAREQFPLLDQIAGLKQSEPQFPTTMVVEENAEPRESYLMLRGDFLRRGATVTANVPAVLPPLPANEANRTRLDLAKWLVSPDQPLTPRVYVNRVWQRYFGRGLVETENDFGTQGDRPTHPELLDGLAAEFVRTGWDVKRLHRLIVTSAVYRQSSDQRPDVVELDPVNKLLARQNRLRLDAEFIRDAALSASGLLTTEFGGPPVTPPQPDGVFEFTQDKKPWTTATDRQRYRRGLYTLLLRSSLYPSMSVFDFPDPNVACTRRTRSNTPLQSLTLANDQTFVEFARGLADRILQIEGDDSTRLRAAVKFCLSREPASLELSRLSAFLHEQRTAFTRNADAAKELATETAVNPAETAAWVAVSRVLLNLDEFITRE
ncbi:MAG: PSD1 and planctomycete cytochrome C domain-containing protein [Planctomycetaceae bacterium]|nr:PSD1 and planctomycete cytochrome C domain-containing protein [Planctomycetaceae bacterium]